MSENIDLNQIKKDIKSGKLKSNRKSDSSKYKMFFFLMIPTIIAVFVAYLAYSNMINFFNYAEATAEVVETVDDTRSYKGSGKIASTITAELQDIQLQIITKNGDKVQVPLMGSDRNTFKVGDKVDIYYNSFNYSDASLKSDSSIWKTTIIFLFPLFFCLLFGFLGLMVLFKG